MASTMKASSSSIRVAICNRVLKKTPPPPTMGGVTNILPFCTQAPSHERTRALFDSWCEKYKKMYSCDEEKEYRFKVFQETVKEVNDHNAKESSKIGLNIFADMNYDELLNTYSHRCDPRAAGGKLIHVHSNDEYKRHIESKKPVVLYFIKRRRCSKGLGDFVNSIIAEPTTNVIFLKINANELKALADEYAVEEVPTFVFLKGGKEVDRIVVGTEDIPDLMRKIHQHVPIIH